MKHTIKTFILFLYFFNTGALFGQDTKKVLFLGNSYTATNNIPLLTSNMAASTGKTLIYDSYTPGGYYLAYHLTDSVSLSKIAVGNWNQVVLQDQSMALAYPSTYMNFIPYCVKLDSTIKAHNLCAQTMFYGTWSRKNGDTYLCTPPECAVDTWITRTFYEMDSAIQAHYKVFADSLKASMTPVGTVWEYIRQNYPSIELFQPDESHPSLEGSYAAACCFYTTLFRSDPTLITYSAGLSATVATNIKNATKEVIYNHLSDWNIGPYDYLLDKSCLVSVIDNENAQSPYWKVFLDPVTNILSIAFLANNQNNKVHIYNTLGVLVKEVDVVQAAHINFSTFPNNLYIVKSLNNSHTFKVVKK